MSPFMLTQAFLAGALFLIPSPAATPDYVQPPAELCIPLAPEPSNVDVDFFDHERADGSHVWGASAEYELSTGDLGEVHLVVDEEGIGEAYFAINGHIVSHASLSESSEAPSPVVVSWVPTRLEYSRDLVVELLQEQVAATMLNGIVPQEFKCSAWGRKAMKAGKYLMIGVIGASAAACTAVSQGVATLACGAGAAVGIHGVAEFADDYCE